MDLEDWSDNGLDLKIKTNAKFIQKRFKRLQRKFPRIIDKGIKQAGFNY
jgi:hypothetical protein